VDEPGAFEPKAVHRFSGRRRAMFARGRSSARMGHPRYFTNPAERAAASMPS
jgi:hypothetical protein